jgi:hypothetical protein
MKQRIPVLRIFFVWLSDFFALLQWSPRQASDDVLLIAGPASHLRVARARSSACGVMRFASAAMWPAAAPIPDKLVHVPDARQPTRLPLVRVDICFHAESWKRGLGRLSIRGPAAEAFGVQ